MGRFSRLGNALYEGDVSIDFIGKRYVWYGVSLLMLLLAAFGLIRNGLDLGIEFEGGAQYTISVTGETFTQNDVDEVTQAVAGAGIEGAANPVGSLAGTGIQVQTEAVTARQSDELIDLMAKTVGTSPGNVSASEIGPAYGAQVAKQAGTGLVVFLILVVIFIWAYFREWKMSVSGLIALAHDVLITVGIYALSGFEVTPATVTGLLTILGFSLYDTVVVFDKVRENTKNLRAGRMTYAQAANLAVNQTLVRSINTSVVALLPVGAILYVGVTTLGAGPLRDLALSLFVGMAVGAYSSIFIATPIVVQLKSREKAVSDADRRAKSRARREADRYAAVPVFADGMPIAEPPAPPSDADDDEGVETEPERTEPRNAPPRRPEATGLGRVAPAPKGPLGESRSAGRNQPSRQSRSRRPKK